MKKFFKVLLAFILSTVLALILASVIGLVFQSPGLAVFSFLPLLGFSLWRSLRTPSASKSAGKLLGLTGFALLLLPFAILIAIVAALMGGFGSGSGSAGGAIVVALIVLVVGAFIILVPMGIASSALGIYLHERRSKKGSGELAGGKAPNPPIEKDV